MKVAGRTRAPRRGDIAIAAALLVFGQLEVPIFGVPGNPPAAHVLWAVAAIAALFRRSHPLLFAVVGAGALGLRYRYGLTPDGGAVFGILGLLSIYGAGAYTRGVLRSAAAAAFAVALQVLVSWWVTAAGHGPLVGLPAVEWVGQFSIYLAAAIGGFALRDRSEALQRARARAEAVPTEREAVEAALAEERTVVARDLQALVDAAVRSVRTEAGRASSRLAHSPEQASEALARAGDHSRAALAHMRRMLAVLRSSDGAEGPRAIPPTGTGEPVDRVPAWLRRQGMPLLVLAIGLPEAILASSQPPEIYGDASLAVRIVGVAALALAFLPRRRWPLAAAAAVAGVMVVRVVVLDDFFALNMPLYLAAFAAGAYGRTALTAGLGGLILLGSALAVPSLVGQSLPAGAYVYVVATTAAAWATGYGGRRRLAQSEELHRLAEVEEERRRVAAERAVNEERLRVARDLHDLVGHGLTSIILQCAGGRALAASDPPRAREAIGNAVVAAETTLEELAQLQVALGGSGERHPRSEADIGQLVDGWRATGMPVELRCDGLEGIDAGQSTALYRIVQEALTNAAKHGPAGAEVTVEIERGPVEVVIAIANEVDPGAAREAHGGHGLLGIAERARIYGGDLEFGAAEGGTWTTRASIPLDGAYVPASGSLPISTSPLS